MSATGSPPSNLCPELATLALHAGAAPDAATGSLLMPIYQTATFVQQGVGLHRGYTYSRTANPTVTALERRLAALEGGEHALAYASGLAATTGLALALLAAGDRVVLSDVVYGGTARLFADVLERFGVAPEFVDTADPDAVAAALARPARLVFVETPANPTLKLTDLALVAGLARDAGALLAVDNTLLTPVLQRPFAWGADLVLHSTTKFIDGHNATIGGALVVRDAALAERLAWHRNALGLIQSPFDAWLTLQGAKTLPLRMRRHEEGARRVGAFLAGDRRVTRLIDPGAPEFPQAELARRQQAGGGALLAFEVRGGGPAARRVLASVRLCTLAENLGAAETLITHPASMTHAAVPEERRRQTGITDGLIRLSVGLEDPADLIADLDRALTEVER
ncbi:MAG: PLP-dependent aspartate aminotransferase family protein [Thermoanaerobaculia bacterium]|nr:PLP-dependent aspartate aminotransferase family protein [Thermoanaerobaculia bacterium]